MLTVATKLTTGSKQLKMYMPQGKPYDTLHRTVSADLSHYTAHVAFAAFGKDANVTRFEKLELAPGLAEEFRRVARLTFDDILDDLCSNSLRIHSYAAATKLHVHEIEHLQVSGHTNIQSQINMLSSITNLEPFEEEVEFVSDLRFYVIVLQALDAEPIYCFRGYTAKNQLKRSWFAALRGPGYYNAVTEPGFLFDQNVDSICCGDDMYIINKDKFQRTFQFYTYLQHDAAAALKKLEARVPIANLDQLQQTCTQEPRIAAIVASLLDAPHLDVLSITRIKREIERLSLSVDVSDDKLVYSSGTRWEFLNLICDNYARSMVTDTDYEMNSKRPLHTSG
jgi:hypothetical protein